MSGIITISEHALERYLQAIGQRGREGIHALHAASEIRRHLSRAQYLRDFERRGSDGLPSYELIDLDTHMMYRVQALPDRMVVATCFPKGVCRKDVA